MSRALQDVSVKPDAAPEAQPFRLLDLPLELRNWIYEATVVRYEVEVEPVPGDNVEANLVYRLTIVIDVFGWSDDRPMLNLCLCNRQIRSEVYPTFYSKTLFNFHTPVASKRHHLVKVLRKFLEDRPQSVALVQRVEVFTEKHTEEEQIRLLYIGPEEFSSCVEYIVSCCQLQSIKIKTFHWDQNEMSDFHYSMTMFGTSQEVDDIPDWIVQLTSIHNLQRLKVKFKWSSAPRIRDSIRSLKVMLSTMVQRGSKLQGMEGIKMQLSDSLTGNMSP
ncbi:hypothetical protein E8E12_003682 [Didymella heteroderae]|uniref:Uncharacterized protein n=1 Tax=Didymella heteroderae TaxID=1769908 RepID=A0A9P5BX96_9PLEO|nr:hypothetical protein E8E12_003682 [Didymella heteroderae]